MSQWNTIDFEQGWGFLQLGIKKLKNTLEGLPEQQFTSSEYMMIYECVYKMCTQKPPHDYSLLLYEKYKETYQEYITYMVLPSLRDKHGELMLREFVKRWTNHKVMVKWLTSFFSFLDRYFTHRRSLPTLNEVGLSCFHNLVYNELNAEVTDAVISLIEQEREGKQIDRSLLKNVIDIFIEIGMGQMMYYNNDFEAALLMDTKAYYSRKASNWMLVDSRLLNVQAEECWKRERDRVSHYLHFTTEPKLFQVLKEAFTVIDNEGVTGNSSQYQQAAEGLELDLQDKFKELKLCY